ncbi:hypothetical protein NQ176_g2995 [Zarea fungicola]|uniref:Uncharacterized protein n=1 Tax=Zarea fungicola TaxID=93591 RepID=A0ACC1NN56_9HYPO|nr:hypothetical protein NQ176_g2995 [Lecanicillium fungicola]
MIWLKMHKEPNNVYKFNGFIEEIFNVRLAGLHVAAGCLYQAVALLAVYLVVDVQARLYDACTTVICERLRVPSTSLLSFLRPFSSTPAVAQPPRESRHQHAFTPRTPTPSSTSRLQSINKDRVPTGGPYGRSASGDAIQRMGQTYKDRAAQNLREKQEAIDYLKSRKLSNDYLRQMPRRWAAGDVYSPHDLSPREMDKWRARKARDTDVVDILGLRPLDMYKNFSLIQEFTTSSGQIKPSTETGLRPVNQRKVAKMIRRIQGMGLYPTIHDHPELIRSDFFPSERKA